jgi:hypothetical protein
MAMSALLYPDPNRSAALLDGLSSFFSQLTFVRHIMVFGSSARYEQDRWSDLDMIVVTNQRRHFGNVYEALRQHKPIVHHNPLTPQVEPSGGHLLGVVFADESVFHNLDLNFLSLSDYQSSNALQRFGQIKIMYSAKEQPEALNDEPTSTSRLAEHVDEIRIGNTLHWTKKAVKKVLRQRGSLDDVKTCSDALKHVMDAYTEDVVLPNGNISQVARMYIEIADLLLNNPQGIPS